MVNVRRILTTLGAVVVVASPLAGAQAPGVEPGGATVIAATPHVPAPEPESPTPASEPEPPPPREATEPQPSPDAQTPATTGINQCIEVTSANLGLATAQDRDAARAAADTLEKYDPPANVRNAIEYFVGARGAMFNDPNFATRNKAISDWVKQKCPS